jgi:hypothetical protein
VGFEHLAAVVTGRAHPIDLLLQSTPDLRVGGEESTPSSVLSRNGTS